MSNEMQTSELVDGVWVAATPYPFFVRTFFGRWLPVCTKHKLIFNKIEQYYDHARKNDCEDGEVLLSDHKRHLKGYKKAKP